MKTANGVILLPHRPFESSDTTTSSSYTHASPFSADWSDDSSLFRTTPFLPAMSIFSFILLLIAMVVVVSVGIRIAMLSGRTTGPAGMMMRWRGQQTPLSPLAFGTGKKRRGLRRGEEESDEEMGLDVVDEEKRMMAMTLDVPKKSGSERDARVWRSG